MPDRARLGPVRLRTFLGTAPGVGKTFSMLNEGWRAAEAGQRVVVGWLEPHCRTETRAPVQDLEVVTPRTVDPHGSGSSYPTSKWTR